MRAFVPAIVIVPMLAACASQPVQTAEQTTRKGFNDATHAPFEDLNLVRSKIPKVLVESKQDPYARPNPLGCQGLGVELARLDDALGPDVDAPRTSHNRADRSASFAANAGARAMKDMAEGWIPMRSWVRYMTGAEQHSAEVTSSVSAGQVRRAYLKGLAQSEGCLDIGPAQPIYVFPAPPHTPSSTN